MERKEYGTPERVKYVVLQINAGFKISFLDSFLTPTKHDHETHLRQPPVLATFPYPYGTIQSARILFLSSILGESELKSHVCTKLKGLHVRTLLMIQAFTWYKYGHIVVHI